MLAILGRKQTYINLAYLLLSFPFGLTYFIFLVVGLSVSAGLIVVWIGIPLLLMTMGGWWGFALFERYQLSQWLGLELRPVARPDPRVIGVTARLMAFLRNPVTWKSFIYLSLKFPFGIFAFVWVVVLFTVSLAFIFAPVLYIVSVSLPRSFGKSWFLWVHITAGFDLLAFLSLFLACPLGLGIGLVGLHLSNGITRLWGRFGQTMLSASPLALRLEATIQVAERERARATRADQSRRELIVNVSHDLRTPIATIRGHVESLMMSLENPATPPSPDTLHTYLDIVYHETERLGALVDDLLTLARADSDELRLEIVPVQAADVIEEVYRTIGPLAWREREISVVKRIVPNVPLVLADRQRLLQVVLNLVRNAVAYTPQGGLVSLALDYAGPQYLILSVADTGPGIGIADQSRIFERFYRTDASRTRSTGGFGLGLAIVRDLVTAMGGTISLESALGEGSCFRVALRIAAVPAPVYPNEFVDRRNLRV